MLARLLPILLVVLGMAAPWSPTAAQTVTLTYTPSSGLVAPATVTFTPVMSGILFPRRAMFRCDVANVGDDLTVPYSITHTFEVPGTWNCWVSIANADGDVFTSPNVSMTVAPPPPPPDLIGGVTTAADHFTIRLQGTSFHADARVDMSASSTGPAEASFSGAQLTSETSGGFQYRSFRIDDWDQRRTLSTTGLYFWVVNPNGAGDGPAQLVRTFSLPPTVMFTSHANGAALAYNSNATFAVNVEDPEALPINKVDFLRNGTLLGTDTAHPYARQWLANTPGAQTITARAFDNRNVTGEANVSVTVGNPVGSVSVQPNPCIIRTGASTCSATITWNSSVPPASGVPDVQAWLRPPSPAAAVVVGDANGSVVRAGITTADHVAELRHAGNVFAPATFRGALNRLPTVALTAPVAGSTANSGSTIVLAATASDLDAGDRILRVEFLDNGVSLGSDTTAPYTRDVHAATPGTHAFTAKAYDDFDGVTTSATRTVTVNAVQAPYGGNARPVPGRVEAEHFDDGGPTVAYNDTTPDNVGGVLRPTQHVDLATCTDPSGSCYAVGWTDAGEWLAYTVNVTQTGTYNVAFRVSSPTGGSLRLMLGDQPLPGSPVSVPATGDHDTYATVYKLAVPLTAGQRVLRVQVDAGNFNFNWFELQLNRAPNSVAVTAPAANAQLQRNVAVNLAASASDPDGGDSVSVEFLIDGAALYTDPAEPFAVSHVFVAGGAHTIAARATDRSGAATTSPVVNVNVVVPRVPFVDPVPTVPGAIVAVEYDIGGEGATYHDTTPGNTGGSTFRGDGVDIAGIGPFALQHRVTQIAASEWLDYSVDATAGTYTAAVDVGRLAGGGRLRLQRVDAHGVGQNLGNAMTVPATGDARQIVYVPGLTLPAGRQVLRLLAEVGGFDLHGIALQPNQSPTAALQRPVANQAFAVGARVRVIAQASDLEGPLQKVEFRVSPAPVGAVRIIGEDTSAPYEVEWIPDAAGNFDVVAIATDAAGAARASASIGVRIHATQQAYPALPQAPTLVEAENYDTGGEGISLHELDAGALSLRNDDVDMAPCTDEAGCGFFVQMAPGEWLEYTVLARLGDSAPPGLEVRANTSAPADAFDIHLDGQLLPLGPMPDAVDEYSPGTWRTIRRWPVTMLPLNDRPYGQTFRITAKQHVAINYFALVANSPPFASIVQPKAGVTVKSGRFVAHVEDDENQFDRVEFFLDENNTGTFPATPWRIGQGSIQLPIESPVPDWVIPAASDLQHRVKLVAYDRGRARYETDAITFHTTDRTGLITAQDCQLDEGVPGCDVPVTWTSNIVDPPGSSTRLMLYESGDTAGTQIGSGPSGTAVIHLDLMDRVELRLIQPRGALVTKAKVRACLRFPLTLDVQPREASTTETLQWHAFAGCDAETFTSFQLLRTREGETQPTVVFHDHRQGGASSPPLPFPYEHQDGPLPAGTYRYVAQGELGDWRSSNEVVVVVGGPGSARSVGITLTPSTGLDPGEVVQVKATPGHFNQVDGVRFFRAAVPNADDGVEICATGVTPPCEDTTAPYEVAWTLPAQGRYYVYAKARGDSETMRSPDAIARVGLPGEIDDQPAATEDDGQHLSTPGTGIMPVEADVDGGSAGIRLPIAVPPGRRGMQPSFALTYGSRSGVGIAGLGWSLSGGSSIHRCPRTPAQDNFTRSVQFDANDALCLDGQRLLPVSDPDVPQGATSYRTEIDSDARIVRFGALDNVNTTFKVEHKGGEVAYYGGSAAVTRPVLSGNVPDAPMSWHLHRREDRAGNTVDYEYVTEGAAELLLKVARYTGTASTPGNRRVEFDYEPLSVGDTLRHSTYLATRRIDQTRVLSRITTYAPSSNGIVGPVRQYRLTYDPASPPLRRQVTALRECAFVSAPDTYECLPATNMQWTGSTPEFRLDPIVLPGLGSGTDVPVRPIMARATLDFDGDGSNEALIALNNGTQRLVSFDAQRQLRFDWPLASFADYALGFGTQYRFADFDGDGRGDLVGANASGQLVVGYWNGIGNPVGAPSQAPAALRTVQVPTAIEGGTFHVADLDGDGHTDVLVMRRVDTGPCDARIETYRNIGNPAYRRDPDFVLTTHDVCLVDQTDSTGTRPEAVSQVEDYNGDGVLDIFVDRADAVGSGDAPSLTLDRIYLGRAEGGGIGYAQDHRIDIPTTGPQEFRKGAMTTSIDLNADGLVDRLYARHDAGATSWFARVNVGGGNYGEERVVFESGTTTRSAMGLREIRLENGLRSSKWAGGYKVADVDADGRPELLIPWTVAIGLCAKDLPPSTPPTCDGMPCEVKYYCPEHPASGERLWNREELSLPFYDEPHGNIRDSSLYHYRALHFAERTDGNFNLSWSDPNIVSSLGASGEIDLYGDGLTDVLTSIGCRLPGFGGYADCIVADLIGRYDEVVDERTEVFWPMREAIEAAGNFDVATGYRVFLNTNLGVRVRNELRQPAALLPGMVDTVDVGTPRADATVSTRFEYHTLSASPERSFAQRPLYRIEPRTSGNAYVDDTHYYFASSMPVVSAMHRSSGLSQTPTGQVVPGPGVMVTREYSYDEAVYNAQGRGFQGFRKITVDDAATGLRGETVFHQIHPRTGLTECEAGGLVGEPLLGAGTTACAGLTTDPTPPVEFTLTEWGCPSLPGVACAAPWRILLLSAATYTHDLADRKLSSVAFEAPTYDARGNVTRHVSTMTDHERSALGNPIPTIVRQETVTSDYGQPDTQGWWLDRVVRRQTSTQVSYQGERTLQAPNHDIDTTTAKTEFFDHHCGLRVAKRHAQFEGDVPVAGGVSACEAGAIPGGLAVLDTTTTYDGYGNPGLATRTARQRTAGGNWTTVSRSEATVFDGSGYFPARVDRALGHTSSTTFDPRFGTPLTMTDVASLTTRSAADIWGRGWKLDPPVAAGERAGRPTYVTYKPCDVSCRGTVPDAVLVEVTQQQGSSTAWRYLDRLGRVVRTEQTAFDAGERIASTTAYAENGQVLMQSGPFHSSPPGGGALTAGANRVVVGHDQLGRVIHKDAMQADLGGGNGSFLHVITTYEHRGLKTSINVSNPGVGVPTLTMSRTYTSDGKLLETTDSVGRSRFWYSASGLPLLVEDARGGFLRATYNDAGERIAVNDPSRGRWEFVYNGFGELTEQRDARSNVAEDRYILRIAYDDLGRLVHRDWREGTAENVSEWDDDFFYDAPAPRGALRSMSRTRTEEGSTRESIEHVYGHDGLSRVTGTQTNLLNAAGQSETFESVTHYDGNYGRVKAQLLPHAVGSYYTYDANGYLFETGDVSEWVGHRDPANGYNQRVLAMDAFGAVTDSLLAKVTANSGAPGMRRVERRDPGTGWPLQLCVQPGAAAFNCDGATYFGSTNSGRVLDLAYWYDGYGNLKRQVDRGHRIAGNGTAATNTLGETFEHDQVHRLKRATRDDGAVVGYSYDALGNLLHKTDYSTPADQAYTYATDGSSRLQSVQRGEGGTVQFAYDANGNVTRRYQSSFDAEALLRYDIDNRPLAITAPDLSGSEFRIGPDGQRYLHRITGIGAPTEIVYVGDYERETRGATVTHRYRQPGDALLIEGGDEAGLYFIHGDRLGSAMRITRPDGSLKTWVAGGNTAADQHGYDAFGKVRDGDDWGDTGNNRLASRIDRRGFTEHEHVDDFKLTHMNGRLYDPLLGRFYGVDPVIQFPENSQGLNPYSYILNNPLAGTDPTGYQVKCATDWRGLEEGQTTTCTMTDVTVGSRIKTTATVEAVGKGNGIVEFNKSNGATFLVVPIDKARTDGPQQGSLDTTAGPARGALKHGLDLTKEAFDTVAESLTPCPGSKTGSECLEKTLEDRITYGVVRRVAGKVIRKSQDLIEQGLATTSQRILGQQAARQGNYDVVTRFWKRVDRDGRVYYQRDDLIDPFRKDRRGRTNLERMRMGIAPIGPDGRSMHLHHTTQTMTSPLAEVTHTFHEEKSRIIHVNPPSIPSGIDRKAFKAERRNYWQRRALDFM